MTFPKITRQVIAHVEKNPEASSQQALVTIVLPGFVLCRTTDIHPLSKN